MFLLTERDELGSLLDRIRLLGNVEAVTDTTCRVRQEGVNSRLVWE